MSEQFRRPGGNWSVSRIRKDNNFLTVLYEIDMLRFAYGQVVCPREEAREADVWVFLEVFLLHYRNLLDFFGKEPRFETDVSIASPKMIWSPEDGLDKQMPEAAALKEMQDRGIQLWKEYDDPNQREDTISRYLQHCTTYRTGPKEWFPIEMMREMESLLGLFERYLPEFKPATQSGLVDREHFMGGSGASTQS
jgi:hypothetical protein